VAVSLVLCAVHIAPGHNWGGDFALYISQARAMVEGTTAQLADAQRTMFRLSANPPGPLLYPVAFPLMLAPIYAVTGLNFVVFKWFCAACLLAALPVLFLLVRPRIGPPAALALTALVGVNAEITEFANQVLSDLPFLLVSLVALLAVRRWHTASSSIGRQVLIGVLLAACFLTRTIGFMVLVATVAAHVVEDGAVAMREGARYIRGHGRRFVPYVVFGILVLAARLLYPPATYGGSSLSISGAMVLGNAAFYAAAPRIYFGNPVVWAVMAPLMVLGILRHWRSDLLLVAYCAFSLGVLLAWRDREGGRFLIALFPFIVYFAFLGAASLRRFVPARALQVAGVGLVLAVGSQAVRVARRGPPPWSQAATTADALAMYDFIVNNSRIDDLVIFRRPRVLRLFTGRNGFRLRGVDDIPGTPAAYFVTGDGEAAPYPVVYQNASFTVYRVVQ